MDAIIYQNTKTNLPGWVNNVHENQPRGMAYIQDNYFVHLYGESRGLRWVSIGLTASQQVDGALEDWVVRVFGAEDIRPSKNLIGEVISGVWRPGIHNQNEIFQAFSIDEHEQRSAEQALRILIGKLDDLFLYIEPEGSGLTAFSHKTRELLLLACTELENVWKQYMKIAIATPTKKEFSTIDYVKLCAPLFLSEYELKLKPYKNVPVIMPFKEWDSTKPSQSLVWYDAYNKTKHDRTAYFGEATLFNCICAVAANIVMFCVRFSPSPLFQGSSSLSTLMNQLFEITLVESDAATFYIPKIVFQNNRSRNLVCGQAKDFVQPWVCKPLVLA